MVRYRSRPSDLPTFRPSALPASPIQLVDERKSLSALHHGPQRCVHLWIEQAAHLVAQVTDRLLDVHRIAESAARRERVEGVAGGEDAAADADLRAPESARIARAVEMLVVVVHVLHGHGDVL